MFESNKSACDCLQWEEGSKQLKGFIALAWAHGIYYSGAMWSFCPWCGKKLIIQVNPE